MKKYIFLIIGLAVFDVVVSVLVSTHMMSLQQDYARLRQTEKKLQSENNRLAREVAHMSSLQKISKSAQNLGLSKTDSRVVYVEKDIFAALR